MKYQHRSIVAALSVSTLLLTPSFITISNSTASEKYGELVQGRILETYKRLGGFPAFGNAITKGESKIGGQTKEWK